MSDPFGWNAYLDKRSTPCAYCAEPSTETLVIEPDEYANGELKRRGKRVGVCAAHHKEPEERAPATSFRRRRDKEAEQLGIELDDPRRSKRDAIYGNEQR